MDREEKCDIMVNEQGDLPSIAPGAISAIFEALQPEAAAPGTLVGPIVWKGSGMHRLWSE